MEIVMRLIKWFIRLWKLDLYSGLGSVKPRNDWYYNGRNSNEWPESRDWRV